MVSWHRCVTIGNVQRPGPVSSRSVRELRIRRDHFQYGGRADNRIGRIEIPYDAERDENKPARLVRQPPPNTRADGFGQFSVFPDYSWTRGIGFQPAEQERQARCLSHFSRSWIIRVFDSANENSFVHTTHLQRAQVDHLQREVGCFPCFPLALRSDNEKGKGIG